ncbi:MAG: 2-amino-4-hydroxy-6-hydroxymethyldihydropteridine diphosphokinase [Bacteroidetes bacterium]|nr:2-amino-4-hydroxy-6-hydroxymethyldihydropteridine diphosphokinase [Bacteroidota bacterium]
MNSKEVYLLLGSNLGDRHRILEEAKTAIKLRLGRIATCSSIYETGPWGFTAEHLFLNQVIRIETVLNPENLLRTIMDIEEIFGRKRNEQSYESRTLDIDILFYADEIIKSEGLTIPHPLIPDRKFVLIPLAEIAPNLIHPVSGKTINVLLKECEDPLKVSSLQS